MARFRLSAPAQQDLQTILATSRERWGEAGRARYASLLAAAIRLIAERPSAPTTRPRDELGSGLRSFHLRHARRGRGVRIPTHVIFFRSVEQGVIEIVRLLHEHMDPVRHLDPSEPRGKRHGRSLR
ncbi:MAG TPA: type II toxin-antitoxin system RelE/ParE family toxin [Acidobacteriota bacterium]